MQVNAKYFIHEVFHWLSRRLRNHSIQPLNSSRNCWSLLIRRAVEVLQVSVVSEKQVVKKIRRKAASPCCHPSRWQMDSSDHDSHLVQANSFGAHWASPPNGISIGLAVFAYTAAKSQCFSVGRTTPKIGSSPWGIGAPSNAWFIGPIRLRPRNVISIGSAVFAELKNVTNRRPTDHAILLVQQ